MSQFVSVVTPAYNEGDNIRKCIASLQNQDFPRENYEIIVVDNNSSDNTAEVVKSLDVTYTFEGKQGCGEARNAGIRLARGEIIALIDSDCIADPGWLKHLVAAFDDPTIGCAAGEITVANQDSLGDLEKFLLEDGFLSQKPHLEHPFLPFAATANTAYRKDVIDRIGLFTESMNGEEDADLSWRMQLETDYKVAYVPESLVSHPYESSLKDLFKQKRRHAFSSVHLHKIYAKYQQEPDKNSAKTVYWQYRSILGRWAKLGFQKLRGKSDFPEEKKYRLVIETAHKIGLLQGSIKNRVWYV